jgi:hypothetical protein
MNIIIVGFIETIIPMITYNMIAAFSFLALAVAMYIARERNKKKWFYTPNLN